MRENLLNILSDSNKDIDNQKLMDYISGRLSAQDRHEVEKWMLDNPFFNEAVEGLQQLPEEKNVQATVEQLNKQLRKYLHQKKQQRKKKLLSADAWTYVAVLLTLALAALVYLMIRYMD